jgi:hypothetical protein
VAGNAVGHGELPRLDAHAAPALRRTPRRRPRANILAAARARAHLLTAPCCPPLLDLVNTHLESERTIDLVLIDQQSVGKRSPHLMDTVNAKKRWTTIYWRVNNFLKKSRI